MNAVREVKSDYWIEIAIDRIEYGVQVDNIAEEIIRRLKNPENYNLENPLEIRLNENS